MSKPLVSYVIITLNRKDDLRDVLLNIMEQDYEPKEIVLIDNGSTDGTDKLIENEFQNYKISYVRLPENVGVSGARNIGINKSRGEIIVTIDDDALFQNKNATSKIVEKFQEDRSIGIIAFKVLHYHTGELEKSTFPFRDKLRDPNLPGEAVRYIGVGHAIPKHIYKEVGLYSNHFPYGHEEMDIALRVLDRGYKIWYLPQVIVLHKRKPVISRKERVASYRYFMLANRIKPAIRYLPWRYVITTSIAWSIRFLFDTHGNTRIIRDAFRLIISERQSLLRDRQPIKRNTIRKIKSIDRHLYW